ncbi:hypothetical protein VSH64_01045 [Amycolatopsis rhabdoformis]|uniref:Uncharacterized protein n=1 Tax=Amycolatopsis rhabdoformis TaxID=1448059 RepID=A0ABZ1I9R5_9PSEU|nr:hypothetical protein [Amycolatopsis rhabdoformis]WSE30729.1 hypothetical protein VSH64_01045 [Amycolatopsis rhabdoformis]
MIEEMLVENLKKAEASPATGLPEPARGLVDSGRQVDLRIP